MALLYFDNFTDANGTVIQDHTADTGQSYGVNNGFKIQTNRLYCDDISTNVVEALSTNITTDFFSVEIDFRKVTDAGNMGILIGTDAGLTQGWMVRVSSGQSLQLWRISGGGFSLQGSYVFSYADGTDFKVTFERSQGTPSFNQRVIVYLDGVNRIQPVDQAHAVAGTIWYRCNVVHSSTTGYHIDKTTFIAPTPPYPQAAYDVDVTGTDVGYLQLRGAADSGQEYGLNAGARLSNNRLYFDSATTGDPASYSQVIGATCDVEYDIDLSVYKHTDAGNVMVVFAMDDPDVSVADGFMLRASTTDEVELWEIISGVYNFRNSYVHSTGDGALLPAIKAEVRTGQIEVFVGGVSRFTHVNAKSKEGDLYLRGNVALTEATGYHLDSITYTAVTNGAGGPLVYNDTFTQETQGVGSGALEITGAVTPPTGSVTLTGFAPTVEVVQLAISVEEQTVNTNYETLDPTVRTFLSVAEQVVNTNYTSNDPEVQLPVRITESLVNTNYDSLDPTIEVRPVPIEITEETKIVQHQSRNPAITLIPTVPPIGVTEEVVNAQYRANRATILLRPEPIGIATTLCFHGELASLEFDGVYQELEFNGTIRTKC